MSDAKPKNHSCPNLKVKKELSRKVAKRAALVRFICHELIKRGVELPSPFDVLVEGDQEEESDRKSYQRSPGIIAAPWNSRLKPSTTLLTK